MTSADTAALRKLARRNVRDKILAGTPIDGEVLDKDPLRIEVRGKDPANFQVRVYYPQPRPPHIFSVSVTQGEPEWITLDSDIGEDTELGLDEINGRLGIMHDETGWTFAIKVHSYDHVQWNAEVRVTPVPFESGTSDRSLVTMRVGPPEWALTRAFADMIEWLREISPPQAGPCFACDPKDPS